MKLLQFSMLCACALFLATSCQKNANDLNTTGATNSTSRTLSDNRYFIDGVEVTEKDFDWGNEKNSYHIEVGEKNNPNSTTTFNYAFTTEDKYDTYMRKQIGETYDIHKDIIAHLSTYAEQSGAVEYLERNGEVPKWYLEYEANYLATHLPKKTTSVESRGLACVLFKNLFCMNAFNLTIPLLGTPFFIFNNNEASAIEGLFLGGVHMCFDKSFYRKKMFTITIWALNCQNFPAQFEDRASSWWCIGL